MAHTLGTRLRLLREAYGWTQEEVSARSVDDEGQVLRRIEVGHVESGRNQARTKRIRSGLANAFGVDENDLFDYLEGRIGLPEFLRERKVQDRSRRKEDPKSPYEVAIGILIGDGYGTAAEVRRAAVRARDELPPARAAELGVLEWAEQIHRSLRELRLSEDPAGRSALTTRFGAGKARKPRSA